MRLLTYLFAAALLWAVAATGPAISEDPVAPAPTARASAPATTPPGAPAPAHPR